MSDDIDVVFTGGVSILSEPDEFMVMQAPEDQVAILTDVPGIANICEPDIDAIVILESGPPGPPGPGGTQELWDTTSPPVTTQLPYLRFARDIDGDVQTIYLGTVT